MSEHSNNKGTNDKAKNLKLNRTTAVVAVILVAAITLIIAITVAANRSKKNNLPADSHAPTSDSIKNPSTSDTREPSTDTQKKNPSTSAPSDTSVSAGKDPLPSFVLPVSGVLSKKHDPELQVYSTTMNDYRVHIGVDIVSEENAPVYAAADGTVSKIWKDVLMGYCIAVQHSGDCLTVYKNLSEELPEGIAEGTKVRSGQLIGSVGESAMIEVAEEPHLHFEMTIDELSVDPLEYFSEKALKSLSIDASHGE